ncbi:MAG: glycosyltransferase family 39 protein, partial [Acidocella sp.]|nr:glycosyltransferase family 39 protein [Acidocella sp.]
MTKRVPKDQIIALLCVAGAVLTRLPVLHRSVIDWDESLYYLMAAAWRAGHLPYTTIWDNKPIGIYAIFAVFQTVIPGIAAIRVAMMVFVAMLAFTVFKITETLTADRLAAAAAAIVLIIVSLSNDGLSSNTELFMASFTALAMFTALTTRAWFLTGLFLGLAFMTKYVMVFEAPVIFAVLMHRHPRPRVAIAAIMGGALPLAATILL